MNRALFPLNSVVLPGGRLPLRLFERRYMDMLTHSLRAREPFVLVLLEQGGSDTSADAAFHPIGCEVSVVDFSPLENGLLGITVEGLGKVSVARNWRETDGLNRGDVVALPEEPRARTPLRHEDLSELLAALCRHPSVAELGLTIDYDDARQVGWRLTELLPLAIEQRQSLVEMDDPLERLEVLSRLVDDME
ncbi:MULTISPECIES: LON peptidase substrate-binding domain-containing protein [Gammaproteobacteria]|jgi:Lon protease-like protein|uniref:Peptidase S16 n=1 Tax=Vreelandella halophila TaxID=86177 RepID=A0A9X4YCK8_9GAMM|nr:MULTISPECIES: LON peptidase substrate-binding domain-containing protein [Gammaproteobacteria]KAA8980708.1 peptidase S16 [Halospina sp. K52047b]MYL26633.1 peptidase S16 [Halomonas utahensis]MYL73970.1 peptidase S16 [Halomonas sp. 22501_18_FS]